MFRLVTERITYSAKTRLRRRIDPVAVPEGRKKETARTLEDKFVYLELWEISGTKGTKNVCTWWEREEGTSGFV